MTFTRAVLFVLLTFLPSAGQAGEVKPFVAGSWAELKKWADSKPRIIHFWGLTCAPCRVEMPEWGKLLGEQPSMSLTLIHAERPPASLEPLTTMLTKSGLAAADNWYFAERFLDRLRYEISPEWRGEVPLTMLVSRTGSVRTIIGSADLDEVRTWLHSGHDGDKP